MSPQSDQPRANSVRRLRLWPPNGFALFPLFCILVFLLHVRLSRVSFEPFFFAVRIQHSLICQTVLSYSSANPSQVPYECFKGSKPHCQLLNSARCLQSEAVSKGCVEFVEAAEQRKRDRSCLHCTSAAVSPMDTTGRVGAYGGRQCITASRVTAQNSTNLLLPVARIPLSLPKTLP